jgi:PD-(D/E)XK nuclease superfamily
MLSRATYPDIWEHVGYPPRPIMPALVGDTVHRALELILRGLHAHRCESLAAPCAVEVLRELGGYSKLVEWTIQEQLTRLESNPRMVHRIAGLQTALRTKVPEIRHRVQSVITRTILKPPPFVDLAGADAVQRGPLSDGSYPEVELRAPELRFVGRADLLTIDEGACVITDYKTGAPDVHHADQLQTYALLWSRDRELNPERLPVRELQLSYPARVEVVKTPTDSELDLLAHQLANRAAEAEEQLRLRPPPAHPAPAMCCHCTVRQLCDEYWRSSFVDASVEKARSVTGDYVDSQAVVVRQSGARSWMIECGSDRTSAVLRTTTETPEFGVGDRLRLLDVAHGIDDEAGRVVLTMTQASEVFLLHDSPQPNL